jgi:hypothetical protein
LPEYRDLQYLQRTGRASQCEIEMTNRKIISFVIAVEKGAAEEYCKVCGSWKLGTIGIGIDLVEEKIRDKFPDISLFRIDSDTTPDEKVDS